MRQVPPVAILELGRNVGEVGVRVVSLREGVLPHDRQVAEDNCGHDDLDGIIIMASQPLDDRESMPARNVSLNFQ